MISALNTNDLIKKKKSSNSATIYKNRHYDLSVQTPSLNQGTILKKYQNKIIKNTEKKQFNLKEGFQNLNINNDGLTSQSISVLEKTSNTNNNASFLLLNNEFRNL